MRGRRCTSCGERFYSAEFTTTCSSCSGEVMDTTEQDNRDAENIAAISDVRKTRKGKQTIDIKALAQAQDDDNS